MLTHFRPRIRSRHPSHAPLRHQANNLPMMPFRSRIRFGSTTPLRRPDRFPVVEINTIEAIKNSSSKLRMKTCFTNNEVKTADWWTYQNSEFVKMFSSEEDITTSLSGLPFPIVAKAHFGSRNNGNTKLDTPEALTEWMIGKDLSRFIFEKYYNYNREYRLHVDSEGCFYTCRKMLKSDAPPEVRWYRNDDHCVWILEDNESFDKPTNWDEVVKECVKALKAVGLDIGAVDLRIQSATMSDGETPREDPEFIIVEINSAPSLGEVTLATYIKELPRILRNKYNISK
jgi:glutathione synthase/RimK-type ligase-like ATP-grasp enzyme